MDWYYVEFDLNNDQPPGLDPQFAFARLVEAKYLELSYPKGFAVYQLYEPAARRFTFYFSPLAAEHFEAYIRSNRNAVWEGALPTEAALTIGDGTTRPA